MKIQESGENYLETILLLENQTGFVRSIDIAAELGYTKPSVSRAMSILKNAGYITMAKSGQIRLTEDGKRKANEIYERHRTIAQYLQISLDIDETLANQDACRIEHIVSSETFDKIKEFVSQKSNR